MVRAAIYGDDPGKPDDASGDVFAGVSGGDDGDALG